MEQWVVVVDGNCYGFFSSESKAITFAMSDFPVAYAQKRVQVMEFVSVNEGASK